MQSRDELVVKEVDFMGDTLMAAKDREGKIWAGVKWFCEGLGLSENQIRRERKRVQSDMVISKGVRNLTLPTNSGVQDVLCLRNDFIPLWLAKINITQSMQENNPELVEKLTAYQLKAKDVLAEAFLPQYRAAEKGYETKATSLGEIASFNKEMDKRMEKQGSAPWKICEAFKMVSEQFGIRLPDDFVKIPEYEQMELICTK